MRPPFHSLVARSTNREAIASSYPLLDTSQQVERSLSERKAPRSQTLLPLNHAQGYWFNQSAEGRASMVPLKSVHCTRPFGGLSIRVAYPEVNRRFAWQGKPLSVLSASHDSQRSCSSVFITDISKRKDAKAANSS